MTEMQVRDYSIGILRLIVVILWNVVPGFSDGVETETAVVVKNELVIFGIGDGSFSDDVDLVVLRSELQGSLLCDVESAWRLGNTIGVQPGVNQTAVVGEEKVAMAIEGQFTKSIW